MGWDVQPSHCADSLAVDVVKSRIQMQNTGEWAFGAVLRTAREEGVGALYKGFAPKVLRLAPGGGVLLLGESLTASSLGGPD